MLEAVQKGEGAWIDDKWREQRVEERGKKVAVFSGLFGDHCVLLALLLACLLWLVLTAPKRQRVFPFFCILSASWCPFFEFDFVLAFIQNSCLLACLPAWCFINRETNGQRDGAVISVRWRWLVLSHSLNFSFSSSCPFGNYSLDHCCWVSERKKQWHVCIWLAVHY